jgi:hypothetical protein
MNSDISILYRFRTSIEILATESGDVRSRLQTIVPILICIQSYELPSQFQKSWSSLFDVIFKVNNNQDSTSYLKRIKNSTGKKIARLIYDIWLDLEKQNLSLMK